MPGKSIDITGKKFNHLTAVRWHHNSLRVPTPSRPKGFGREHWVFRCDCGNEKIILKASVVSGNTKTCRSKACFRLLRQKIRKRKPGEANFEAVWRQYQRQATRKYRDGTTKTYAWKLSKSQFREIISKPCYYCGAPPSNIRDDRPYGWSYGPFVYSGIDRIDNSKGYTKDNVCPSCRTCNRAKDTMGVREFLDWIERVHQKNKGAV